MSREELHSLLYSVVTSTSTLLLALTEGGGGAGGGGRTDSPIADPQQAVKK